jgi:hypothetical protein
VTSSLLPSSDGFVPVWPCSRRGLPGRPHYCERRWSLTPPFHSDPHPCGWGRPVSVALFRQVNASRRFPRPGCYPTPCSMECGLSSIPRTAQDRDRPVSLKTRVSYRHPGSPSTAERAVGSVCGVNRGGSSPLKYDQIPACHPRKCALISSFLIRSNGGQHVNNHRQSENSLCG